jgi:hypothetical protein
MANTYRPSKGVSMRDVPADATDRKNTNDSFKERKANQDKIKDERFAKIEKRRKAARDGKGGGINVEVTGDK